MTSRAFAELPAALILASLESDVAYLSKDLETERPPVRRALRHEIDSLRDEAVSIAATPEFQNAASERADALIMRLAELSLNGNPDQAQREEVVTELSSIASFFERYGCHTERADEIDAILSALLLVGTIQIIPLEESQEPAREPVIDLPQLEDLESDRGPQDLSLKDARVALEHLFNLTPKLKKLGLPTIPFNTLKGLIKTSQTDGMIMRRKIENMDNKERMAALKRVASLLKDDERRDKFVANGNFIFSALPIVLYLIERYRDYEQWEAVCNLITAPIRYNSADQVERMQLET